jgi:hypothetical protein
MTRTKRTKTQIVARSAAEALGEGGDEPGVDEFVPQRAKNRWISIATITPSMTMPTLDATAAIHDCRLFDAGRPSRTG